MANDEHRMVFDLRGRRKRLVQVVYAILAVLMGASLFLTVGPLSISDLFGGGGSSTSANSVLTDQADAIDKKLAKDPNNENLLLNLVRTRYSAGNSSVTVDSSGRQQVTTDATDQYALAADAWDRYLKLNPKPPNPNVAILASNALFTLAANSTDSTQVVANLDDAARAEKIVAAARPTLNSLSTLAYYSYLAGNFKVGDAAAKKAEALAPKSQRKSVTKQIDAYRKQGQSFQTQLAAIQKAQQTKGKPGESLQNPLGGLSGGGGGTSSTTP